MTDNISISDTDGTNDSISITMSDIDTTDTEERITISDNDGSSSGDVLVINDSDYLTLENKVTDLEDKVTDLTGRVIDLESSNQYVHIQAESSETWTIIHNMNKYPSVTLVDNSGTVYFPPREYPDPNTVIIHLCAETSGKAYLN